MIKPCKTCGKQPILVDSTFEGVRSLDYFCPGQLNGNCHDSDEKLENRARQKWNSDN